MNVNAIFLYTDNPNLLCDFYSSVLDCEILFTENSPFFYISDYKFIIKKVVGNKSNSIYPVFSLSLSASDIKLIKSKVELFCYRNNIVNTSLLSASHLQDPAGNLLECFAQESAPINHI